VSADWFPLLLATTAMLRGLGAGAILGSVLITPTRSSIGVVPYAQFTRAQYRSSGVRLYAATTILGALLTALALAVAIADREAPIVIWSVAASIVATVFGFVGTAGALPAMTGLWNASDEDAPLLSRLLDRFGRWGMFSAGWHLVAFVAVISALAALAG
jgi:hypothetical protein